MLVRLGGLTLTTPEWVYLLSSLESMKINEDGLKYNVGKLNAPRFPKQFPTTISRQMFNSL